MAIVLLQLTATGPGQLLARSIIKRAQQLAGKEVEVETYKVPGHDGVEGKKQADTVAKETARSTGIRRGTEWFTFLVYFNRTITERK